MSVAPTTASRLARARLLTGCALISAALPFAALAQDAATDDDVQLDAVLVSSASGKATSLQDAPASITVIGAEELAATGARDLQDVLRTVPGLNITNGNDGGKSVSFRGMSSSRTLTLVDGRRTSTRATMPRDYQGDLSVVPVDAIERIEIVRGPMSTLYGSDAMGGVINIITKKGYDQWSGSTTVESTVGERSGTADGHNISGFVTGPLGKDLTLSAWGKYSKVESPSAATDGRVAAKGNVTRSGGVRFDWAQSEVMSWSAEIGRTSENYLDNPLTADSEARTVSRDSAGITNTWALGGGTLETALRFEFSENVKEGDEDKPVSYDTRTFDTRYVNSTNLGGRPLDYTLGFTATQEKLYDPLYSNRGRTLVEGRTATAALYAEGRLQFSDALTLTAGLRVDQHDKYGVHATPRLYANYDFGGGLVLKAGYSQAFVAPDLRNLNPDYLLTSRGTACLPYVPVVTPTCSVYGNPELRPETSHNYELGLNYQGETLSWEVTGFYNDVSDMIGAQKLQPGDEGYDPAQEYFRRANFDAGKTAGIEAGFSKEINEKVSLTGTATWIGKSSFRYTGIDVDFPMAATPEWNVSFGGNYRATDRLKLNGAVNYVGKQANPVTVADIAGAGGGTGAVTRGQNSKGYFLVNVGASYELTDKVTVNLGIDNLFDKQPETAVEYRENGRLFRLGMTTRF
ncbi:TonB-dependent receptor domain-containing protein [Falsigemmobacter intermedius]|uniref:TonB-dependent receptor n=1 Tax=Falsigemmobacter intermedius TaxID=1553448 RepID=A0A444MBH0_9RHOB|nr:TonB-dependent receptor [Falsigemmobacter intermedius]RWY41077.1 TonB-dependent receptor [Falsigemmobacter intermedius]